MRCQPSLLSVGLRFEIVNINLEFIDWMMENFKWPDSFSMSPSLNSRESYLHSSIKHAAATGKLHVDGNFLSTFYQGKTIMIAPAASGHLHIVRWLHGKGVPVEEIFVASVLGKGQFHVALWLCNHYSGAWTDLGTHAAIVNGQLL